MATAMVLSSSSSDSSCFASACRCASSRSYPKSVTWRMFMRAKTTSLGKSHACQGFQSSSALNDYQQFSVGGDCMNGARTLCLNFHMVVRVQYQRRQAPAEKCYVIGGGGAPAESDLSHWRVPKRPRTPRSASRSCWKWSTTDNIDSKEVRLRRHERAFEHLHDTSERLQDAVQKPECEPLWIQGFAQPSGSCPFPCDRPSPYTPYPMSRHSPRRYSRPTVSRTHPP